MANVSVTNTFTNSTTADASQVNQNFTDIINGTSDGTKDFSISALTVGGTLTANGNVNLGNASGDDLTITASLASTLGIKTTTSYDIGSTTIGLRALYLGDAGSAARATKLLGATIASGWTFTFPTGVPSVTGYHLVSTTAGATSWTNAVKGTATNDAAAAGYVGETAYAEQTSLTNFGTTAQYSDGGSISLTAGDWDVSCMIRASKVGSTTTQIRTGIGTVTGNDGTGLTFGTTATIFDVTSIDESVFSVSPVRVSLASTTTYYWKVRATYSAGTPQYTGKIFARRVR
jgi:hypothetical protein